MNFIKVFNKFVSLFLNPKEKEVSKMKKLIIVCGVALLISGLNVLQAQAYTELQTPVAITASGAITGSTIAFAASIVSQVGSTPASQITFTSPSGVANSGQALKIRGGTNQVGGRVVIYTDNASLFTSQDHDPRVKKVGAVYKPTGIDGAGLVGETEAGYVAALIWGISTTPNTNAAYTFDSNLNSGLTDVFVVDKSHNFSFVGTGTPSDTQAMYRKDGTAVTNALTEGVDSNLNPVALYPQYFGTVGTGDANNWDLYDKINTDSTRVVVSQQLTKNIATIAFSIAPGTGADAGFYVCNLPNLTTVSTSDSVTARLGKADGTPGTEIYVNIGGVFTGLPAQNYSTNKLYVAIVQD